MSELWEAVARSAAQAMPPSDYGSHRVIKDVARLLEDAYARGRSEVTVDLAPEIQRLRAQLAALRAAYAEAVAQRDEAAVTAGEWAL